MGGETDDVSMQGYNQDSPYKNEPYLDINSPSGMITMENVNEPLLAFDGNQYNMLMPGNKYQFNTDKIREYKI